jgi:hypothetical protein
MVQITQVSMTVTPRICERWFWREDFHNPICRELTFMFFPFLERRGAVAVSKKFKQSVNPRARSWCFR